VTGKLKAQDRGNDPGPKGIKLTGIVLEADSLTAAPYTAIIIRGKVGGTVSDNSGYFSIIVDRFDTLEFSSLGYKTSVFVVPDLIELDYSLIQLISKETIVLEEVEIIAWPDEKSFVEAFQNYQLPYDEQDKIFEAKSALSDILKRQYENDKFYYEQMHYSKLYNTTGFVPPNNFLNPLRWSNFIRDWRSGAFKKK